MEPLVLGGSRRPARGPATYSEGYDGPIRRRRIPSDQADKNDRSDRSGVESVAGSDSGQVPATTHRAHSVACVGEDPHAAIDALQTHLAPALPVAVAVALYHGLAHEHLVGLRVLGQPAREVHGRAEPVARARGRGTVRHA